MIPYLFQVLVFSTLQLVSTVGQTVDNRNIAHEFLVLRKIHYFRIFNVHVKRKRPNSLSGCFIGSVMRRVNRTVPKRLNKNVLRRDLVV